MSVHSPNDQVPYPDPKKPQHVASSCLHDPVNHTRGVLADGKAFAEQHLVVLAEELLEWRQTSQLRNGRLRELGRMLKCLHTHDHLGLATTLVHDAALQHVLKGSAR